MGALQAGGCLLIIIIDTAFFVRIGRLGRLQGRTVLLIKLAQLSLPCLGKFVERLRVSLVDLLKGSRSLFGGLHGDRLAFLAGKLNLAGAFPPLLALTIAAADIASGKCSFGRPSSQIKRLIERHSDAKYLRPSGSLELHCGDDADNDGDNDAAAAEQKFVGDFRGGELGKKSGGGADEDGRQVWGSARN